MRPASACKSCRTHRRKCSRASGGVPCVRCVNLSLKCSLVEDTHSTPEQSMVVRKARPIQQRRDPYPSVHPTPGSTLLPEHILRRELVLLYFQHVHDKHHSLFHQPRVELELENGEVPEILLYAMMSLGARFSKAESLAHLAPRDRGCEFVKRTKGLLDMTNISVTTLQACVLLGTISFSESKTEAEALYYAVANRLALILDIVNRPVADEVERQVNLRIYWTLYMIDIWSSTGLQLPRQMKRSDNIALPMEDSLFASLLTNSNYSQTFSSSICAEMVNLSHIWAQIHDLNKATVVGSMEPEPLRNAIEALSSKLNNWSASLHPHLQATKANLERYASFGLGSALAALHLGFHYYNEVLFYQFLAENTYPESASANIYRENCKTHASQFCDLLYTCNMIPGCECLYIMVGHMLVVTSTVYIHTLLFGTVEDQVTIARERLEQNFEILTELQSYWVKLDDSLSRLKAFHNACISSVESSFCMDRWMLSFILEHGTQEYERFEHDGSSSARSSIASTKSPSPDLTLQDWYTQTFPSK